MEELSCLSLVLLEILPILYNMICIRHFCLHFFLAFISLSGNPSVNAYASISFLNIIPVLAFYYFFTKWVPDKWRKAALLASTLFVLSGRVWMDVCSEYRNISSYNNYIIITRYSSFSKRQDV